MPTVVNDWDEFLVSVCSAYRYTPTQDADGGVVEAWAAEPYAAAVACKIRNMGDGSNRVYENNRIVDSNGWKFYFNSNHGGFAIQDKLAWIDADGTNHVAFVTGSNDRTNDSVPGLCSVAAEERG